MLFGLPRYCTDVEEALGKLRVSWYYTWKQSTADAGVCCPAGMEHIPMIWSSDFATADCIKSATAEPSPYLLGFNEPDNKDQANMSVEDALALWPLLMATGKHLGSPATASNPTASGGWQERFMRGVNSKGYRVDFMAVHYYGEDSTRWDVATAVADMKAFLVAIYKKYKKPIWVTEWALVTWFPFPSKYPEEETHAAFAKAAAGMMESMQYVEKYAFFSLPPYSLEEAIGYSEKGTGCDRTSNLFNKDGIITKIGRAYAEI